MERPEPVHIENLFNTFVVQYGGELVRDVMETEPDKPNADYFFRKENVVVELKCLQKDSFNNKEDIPKFQEIINKWAEKKLIPQEDVFGILIGVKPIPECCFQDFKNAVTKTIDRIIYKANKQVGQTKIDLKTPKAKGLLLFANDGNYLYSHAEFLKIIIDLMIRKYSKDCSLNGFVYFTVNQASKIPGSDLDQHMWVPAYGSGNNKKLSEFVNDFGRKFLTDHYDNFPNDKVIEHREVGNEEGIEILKSMKHIPKDIIYKGRH